MVGADLFGLSAGRSDAPLTGPWVSSLVVPAIQDLPDRLCPENEVIDNDGRIPPPRRTKSPTMSS